VGDWSDAGGTLTVQQGKLNAGEALLDAKSGALTVDDDGRLQGALDVTVREIPTPGQALKSPEAAAAAVAQALGRDPTLSATLKFENGRTRLGLFDTGRRRGCTRRASASRGGVDRFDRGDVVRLCLLGHLQIVTGLKIEPELRGGAEQLLQAQSRVDRHRRLATHQLLDARPRDVQTHRRLSRRKAERPDEFLQQNLARMDRGERICGANDASHHRALLSAARTMRMVVH
jgi:hypothetical protein